MPNWFKALIEKVGRFLPQPQANDLLPDRATISLSLATKTLPMVFEPSLPHSLFPANVISLKAKKSKGKVDGVSGFESCSTYRPTFVQTRMAGCRKAWKAAQSRHLGPGIKLLFLPAGRMF